MNPEPLAAGKEMSLRYPGRCRSCGTQIAARERAVYFRDSKSVACLDCSHAREATGSAAAAWEDRSQPTVPGHVDATQPSPDESVIDGGSAGASAQREYERRKSKREQRVRTAHPRIGGFLLAVTDDPQSTKA
jgi:predicted RNA-binding Zn-ribbon protein involved in translation (DUF1610 family)